MHNHLPLLDFLLENHNKLEYLQFFAENAVVQINNMIWNLHSV
jgi:hypothetical protein